MHKARTKREIAEELDVTQRQVERLLEEGMLRHREKAAKEGLMTRAEVLEIVKESGGRHADVYTAAWDYRASLVPIRSALREFSGPDEIEHTEELGWYEWGRGRVGLGLGEAALRRR